MRLNAVEVGYACRECGDIWTNYIEETVSQDMKAA
jgi:hypothetical protein